MGTGTGGSGSGGMSGGTGGMGMTGMPVPCGSNTCMGFSAMGFTLPACCADAAAGTCGMPAQDGSCMPPPMSDPRCPAGPSFGPISVASCCTADNQCGYNAAQLMMGCVSLADVAKSMFGGFLMPPAPQTCDGSTQPEGDGGVDTDGGQ